MRVLLILVLVCVSICSCKSVDYNTVSNEPRSESLVANDTVVIASDESDYEIIVVEPGFNGWLESTARPRGYYSQSFLEQRNSIYVTEWNIRSSQPTRYNPELYIWPIDYDRTVDYGYEVNYKLYNYFIYFQLKYKQRLSTLNPRI